MPAVASQERLSRAKAKEIVEALGVSRYDVQDARRAGCVCFTGVMSYPRGGCPVCTLLERVEAVLDCADGL